MISNYSQETGRLYILSNNSYIYLEDFRTLFNKVLQPELADRLFTELSYLCNVMNKLPMCLVILIFMRVFTSSILTATENFLKKGKGTHQNFKCGHCPQLIRPPPPSRKIFAPKVPENYVWKKRILFGVDGAIMS